MKQLVLSVIFVSSISIAKSQAVFIYAAEKIKGAEIPIGNTDFTVYVNDTLKKKASSMNDGSLGRMSLEKGKYKIKIVSDEFADGVSENVIVNESRSTDVVINLTRLTAAQIEERKKEKK